MITINGQSTSAFVNNFNDGTKQIRFPDMFNRHNLGPDLLFTWLYDSDEEIMTLWYLVNHFRETDYIFDNPTYVLKVPYLPNARMDRVKEFFSSTEKSNPREVFTLKYFCELINLMNFNKVYTFDVHSPVALSLLKNAEDISPDINIRDAISSVKRETNKDVVIVVPDMGAYQRYSNMRSLAGLEAISGIKIRDWHTRAITNLTLAPITSKTKLTKNYLKDKAVLIIDDIIGTGGTISLVIDKLESELGAQDIYAYCSHLENGALQYGESKILDKIENHEIKKIFTTNSIFRKKNKIVDVKLF